jgi:hypothetical protein
VNVPRVTRRGLTVHGHPPHRVEIVIGVRTLMTLLAVAAVVALAILSLGTLLSLFTLK